MKLTILCLAIIWSLLVPVFAEPTFREVVDKYLTETAHVKDRKGPLLFYPRLVERIQGLFLRYPFSHIVITGPSEKGNKTVKTDIYINGENVYVIQADEGWNLWATSEGVFEWERGKMDGMKIKRSNEDLVAYLYYLTDPSWVMAALYHEYLTEPNRFTVVSGRKKGIWELRFKKPRDGFRAIYVIKKPLWFYGLSGIRPNGNGETVEAIISEPTEVKGLPESAEKQFKAIKFQDSELSLHRHMLFL